MLSYEERMAWFNQARFGMFIHWGLYSLLGRGEWAMFRERIPPDEYAKLADQFKPAKFNADRWTSLAKEAGMKYIVLTTRHHDGFCLFDSKVSDFTSVKTAAKKDFVAEYVKSCRKAGLKVGFYYSLLDWRFPGYFNLKKYHPSKHLSDIRAIFVTDYYTLVLINGHEAFYVVGSDVYGPMGKELIPFLKEADAKEFMKDHKGKSILRFKEVTPEIIKPLD